MKTIKHVIKVLVNGYLNSFKESADMMYGRLYNK